MRYKIVFLVLLVLVVLMMGTLVAQEVEVFPIQTSSYWQFERISQRLVFWQRIGGQISVYQLPAMQKIDEFVPGISWVISVNYSPSSDKYYVLGGSESANSADTLLVYDGQPAGNRKWLQSFQLSRTGFHPLYVDSRTGFAFYGRPFLASEPERKFLIFNLANGKVEGEVEATPPRNFYWTAFDEESQRLVFQKINAENDVEGVQVYSTAQRALEKLLPLPSGFKGGAEPGSHHDFNGKYLVVRVSAGIVVLGLDGTLLYKRGKTWSDSDLATTLNVPLAVSYLTILDSQGFLTGIQAYGVNDLSLGIPIYMFPPGEAKIVIEPREWDYGMFVHDNIVYHITSTKIAKITLPPYDRFDRELIFPFVRQNDKEWTGLAVMSPDANHLASAQIRNREGNLAPGIINPVLLDFSSSPQIARFPTELFGQDLLKSTLNNTQTLSVLANQSHALKGFWLYGNPDLTFLDGSTALTAKDAGTAIVMPVQDGNSQVFNSGNRWAAFHITLGIKANLTTKLFDINGFTPGVANWEALAAYQVASTETPPDSDKKYRLVESDRPLVGTSVVGKPGEDVSVFSAQAVSRKKKSLIFAHNATGFGVWKTELILINPTAQVQTAELKLRRDDGVLLRSSSRSIPGNGMLWEDTFSLFGLNNVTGYATAETTGEGLLGWIRFQGWNLASALPAQEPMEEVVFSHVAQVKPQGGLPGWGHGVTVLNPTAQTIEVRAEAFRSNGEKTGENTFLLAPGEKKAQHLNEAMFFGPAFEQAGGYVRLTVLTPGGKIVAFSLFYASNGRVMAAIPGH